MAREQIKAALAELGYEVVRIGTRYATVRERDVYGQPRVRRLDIRAMADEGLLDESCEDKPRGFRYTWGVE